MEIAALTLILGVLCYAFYDSNIKGSEQEIVLTNELFTMSEIKNKEDITMEMLSIPGEELKKEQDKKQEEENKEEILKLYKIQLGREFCPWDDSYPGMKEIEFDLGRESLFVMIDGQEINADAGSKEDRIIAAISIDDDPQVERLDCWSHKLAPGAELSRLAVHPDFQNQKIARQMLVFGMEELARRGYKSVHFLVNKLNVKALRSYAVFGFDTVGECSLFGQPFLCYEKGL